MEPFVGREGLLARLRAYGDDVTRSGIGRMVVLTGEAGIGKTQLSAELARQLTDDGVRAVWSRCWSAGGGPPLWPWPDVIAELSSPRAAAGPLPSSPPAGDRFRVFRDVVGELRRACDLEPCVILIDDLHEATGDAVLLTKFVARSLHRFPLLLLATWRLDATVDAGERLDELLPDATVIDVAPFDEDEVATYLQAHRGHVAPTAEVAAMQAATGGLPLFLAELVRRSAGGDAGSPTALHRLLRRRVAALGADERRVLRAAAVLGDGATLAEVADVAGGAPADVQAHVDALPTTVRIVDQEVRFSHGLLRDVLVASVPARERQRLHLAAAVAIRGTDVRQVVRRAGHHVEAAARSTGDRRAAVGACLDAARTLQRCWEFARAADWASRGVTLADAAPPAVRAELLLARATALLAGGRLADARAAYEAAVEPAEQAGDNRSYAIAALGYGGVWVEEQRDEMSRRRMLSLCERARAALGPDEPVLAALLAVRLAAERTYDGAAADALDVAIDEVRRLGVPAATAEALSLYHHTLLAPAHAARRLEIADELLDAGAQCHASIFSLFGLCWRTVDLFLAGDPRAERSHTELAAQSDAVASRSIGYIAAVLDVMRTIRRGALGDAERLAADALAIGQDVGDADALGYYGGHVLGIRWAQGRFAELRPMIEAVIDSASLRRRDRIYPACLAYALAMEGDHAAARAVIDELRTEGLDTVSDFSNGLATLAVLIEAAAALGEGGVADEAAHHLAPFAELPVMPSLAVICLGPGGRFLGLAHATNGRLDDAIGAFRHALEVNQRLQNGPVDAILHADLAAALRRRDRPGDDAAAAEHAARAIELGTAMGMTARVVGWREDAAESDAGAVAAVPGALEQHDGQWRVAINGRTTIVDDLVGMQYVAELVARPDTDIPAVELSAAVNGGLIEATSREAPALDRVARADYRRRLAELDRQLDLADRRGDADRGRRAADERDVLLDRLRRDSGLGGRARRLTDESERCRARVSKAIQRAIGRIEAADPVLGRALATRIRTGYVCRYDTDPGHPIDWIVRLAA